MTFTSQEDLRFWFFNNKTKRIKSKNSEPDNEAPDSVRAGDWYVMPFWTLRSRQLGNRDTIISYNERETDPEKSFSWLVETINRANTVGDCTFHVLQSATSVRNTGNECDVKFERVSSQKTAGVGSLPALSGYIGEAELERRLKDAEEKWDLKQQIRDLEAEKESQNFIGVIREIVKDFTTSPIGAVFMAKLMNVPISTAMPTASPINGTPASDTHNGPDGPTDEDERISNAIDEIEDSTGLSAAELLEKIARVARHNPEYIKNVASQL